jgi:tRNA nucleotidyltransferase (CCA-adding enzyme)
VDDLLQRLRDLPAAAPLLARVPAQPPVYLVGGAVRDLLLGGTPDDLDLVVEGDAAAVAAALGGELRVHDRFGTSTAVVDPFTYDFATARHERYSRPGALPDVVVPATLDEDLLRRDFTINAIALGVNGLVAGEVRSAPRACDDLRERLLRILHDGSFADDPTRMLRLARYAGRLRFTIEPRTRSLVCPAALKTVTGPRIGNELRLLAREDDPIAPFRCLRDLGLDRAVHPEFGLEDADLARRALALLPGDAGRSDLLVLAVAARGVPAAELRPLLDRLGFDAADRDVIVAAVARSPEVARALESGGARPSAIARAVAGAGPETVALAGALGPAAEARLWLDQLRHVRLSIGGGDLLAAGIPQGPAIGRGLAAALSAKLDGRACGRESELSEAVRAAAETE